MAGRGLITAESSGLDQLLKDLESIDDNAKKALDAGMAAWNVEAKKAVQRSYLAGVNGAEVGDYIYNSISYFGEDTGKVRPTDNQQGVWGSAGVYKIDSLYNAYNQEYQSKQQSSKKRKAMTAAQIAYWIENGTSRLFIDGKLVRKDGVEARAFGVGIYGSESKTVQVAPQPFLSNALTANKNQLEGAFVDAFSIKMTELLNGRTT